MCITTFLPSAHTWSGHIRSLDEATYFIIEFEVVDDHREGFTILVGYADEPARLGACYDAARLFRAVKELRLLAGDRPIFLKWDWQFDIQQAMSRTDRAMAQEARAFIKKNITRRTESPALMRRANTELH